MVVDVRETGQREVDGASELAAAMPLLCVLTTILLSPLLYDFLQWLRRALAGG